jgi:hypothetical protein
MPMPVTDGDCGAWQAVLSVDMAYLFGLTVLGMVFVWTVNMTRTGPVGRALAVAGASVSGALLGMTSILIAPRSGGGAGPAAYGGAMGDLIGHLITVTGPLTLMGLIGGAVLGSRWSRDVNQRVPLAVWSSLLTVVLAVVFLAVLDWPAHHDPVRSGNWRPPTRQDDDEGSVELGLVTPNWPHDPDFQALDAGLWNHYTEERMKKSSRFGSVQAVMPPLMGVLLLLSNLGKPHVQALHGPEVLGLVASGFLLGIGFASLLAWLRPGIFASSTKERPAPADW